MSRRTVRLGHSHRFCGGLVRFEPYGNDRDTLRAAINFRSSSAPCVCLWLYRNAPVIAGGLICLALAPIAEHLRLVTGVLIGPAGRVCALFLEPSARAVEFKVETFEQADSALCSRTRGAFLFGFHQPQEFQTPIHHRIPAPQVEARGQA